jgi:hypothetical protein
MSYREVTGYMVVHTVSGLLSLGTMFPDLIIIRGQRLFFNYALVIYDTDLFEVFAFVFCSSKPCQSPIFQISLRNLLRISRGSVRIDGNNHHLCPPEVLIRSNSFSSRQLSQTIPQSIDFLALKFVFYISFFS